MYAVILAGGGGTRLWPLSTPERPKPFLRLLGDKTLLQLTADRLRRVVEGDSLFVLTDRRYESLVREQVPYATVLSEPLGRNTAPAIAYATVAIPRADDKVMLVVPADQIVKNEPVFQGVLAAAERELARGCFDLAHPLVTLGVETKRAATEYGYLIPDLNRAQGPTNGSLDLGLDAYVLDAFEEKPNQERADELLHQPGVAWNAGMFMWTRGAIRGAFKEFAPAIFNPIARAFDFGVLESVYSQVESVSIDYAVMERAADAGHVVMGSMNVGWNDLGSWASLLAELGVTGIDATIVPSGDQFMVGADDLAVWRPVPGRLASARAAEATMVDTNGPVAILRGARTFKPEIDDLLDRCSTLEAHS